MYYLVNPPCASATTSIADLMASRQMPNKVQNVPVWRKHTRFDDQIESILGPLPRHSWDLLVHDLISYWNVSDWFGHNSSQSSSKLYPRPLAKRMRVLHVCVGTLFHFVLIDIHILLALSLALSLSPSSALNSGKETNICPELLINANLGISCQLWKNCEIHTASRCISNKHFSKAPAKS